MDKLTKQKGIELGYHRNTVADLMKRGAVVIDDVVYAPIKKRRSGAEPTGGENG